MARHFRIIMWYVYVIKSKAKKFLYIGSTNNVERRLSEHNNGLSQSTKSFKPYELLVSIGFPDESRARILEKYFKTGSGRTVLKKRILNDEDLANHEVISEA